MSKDFETRAGKGIFLCDKRERALISRALSHGRELLRDDEINMLDIRGRAG